MQCEKNPDPEYDDYHDCECEHSKYDEQGCWYCAYNAFNIKRN